MLSRRFRLLFVAVLVQPIYGLVGCNSMDKPEPKGRDLVEWREHELTRGSDGSTRPFFMFDDRAEQIERNLGVK